MPCIWSSSAIHLDGSHSWVFWIGKEWKAPSWHWHCTVRREELHYVRKTIHLVLFILICKQFAWSDCPCLRTCDPHTLIPTVSVQFPPLSSIHKFELQSNKQCSSVKEFSWCTKRTSFLPCCSRRQQEISVRENRAPKPSYALEAKYLVGALAVVCASQVQFLCSWDCHSCFLLVPLLHWLENASAVGLLPLILNMIGQIPLSMQVHCVLRCKSGRPVQSHCRLSEKSAFPRQKKKSTMTSSICQTAILCILWFAVHGWFITHRKMKGDMIATKHPIFWS